MENNSISYTLACCEITERLGLDLSWLRCFMAAGACRQSSVALETQMMDEKEGAHTKDHQTCGSSWRPRPPINAGPCSPTNSKKPLFSRLPSVCYLWLGFPLSFSPCLLWTLPVSVQLLLALPHLLFSARRP